MVRGFFITGTDTGVGKTIIAAALIRAISLLGIRVCGMKPIETECQKSEIGNRKSEIRVLIPSDGMFLREIASMDDSIDLITPVRFESPLAPLPASKIENIPIDIKKIKRAHAELSKKYEAIIVEGIGGLLVPIKRHCFVLDLARDFGLPVIVVSRPGLGTINHTMLTVNCAIKEGLTVAGIIINYSRPPEGTLAEKTNPAVLRQISDIPILGIFPYLEEIESTSIEKTAVKSLDIEKIRTWLF